MITLYIFIARNDIIMSRFNELPGDSGVVWIFTRAIGTAYRRGKNAFAFTAHAKNGIYTRDVVVYTYTIVCYIIIIIIL